MKIAILIDQPRKNYLPGEEGKREDIQKRKVVRDVQEVISKRFKCIVVTADSNFILKLQKEQVDMVFNLCNGIRGETRLAQIPAILEFFNIPYTGSSILGHTLSINKAVSSRIFKSKGINTPNFLSIYEEADLDKLEEDMDFPVIIKPADEGSSRGIHQDSLVYEIESLRKKVKEELKIYNPPIMINEYIDGREFTVGVLGYRNDMQTLPILEISYDNLPDHLPKFSSFELKCHYDGYRSKDICPATLDNELEKQIVDTAKRAYNALDIKDYGRVDIRLKNGVPYVLEINSLPGLVRGYSDITKMAEAAGIGYEGLIYSVINSALERYSSYGKENDVV